MGGQLAAWDSPDRSRWRGYPGTTDLNHAAGSGHNIQAKAVQSYDRGNEIEAEPQTSRVSRLVGPVEPPEHGLAFVFADPGSGILHAHDGFTLAGNEPDLHPSARRRKLDGIVDQIGHRLHQQVPVTVHVEFPCRMNQQGNSLVLRYRLVHIRNFADELRECDLAESCQSLTSLDFGKPQDSGNDRKRLIDRLYRPVRNLLQIFERHRAVTTALEKDFGGVHKWRGDFVAAARSLAGGPGWVVLSYSPYDGRLYNQIAIDHSHAMVGAVPILVLDMYEHAYHLEFGPNAAAYVDAFMRVIEWTVVAERLVGATGGQRREADSGKETLPSISVEEVRTFMQGEQQFQVVDARPRNYVSKDPDTMPNAVWRDPERVDEWFAQLSPEAPVFVYCAYGFEVGCRVATTLRERGFDARYIRGGLAAWYGAGGARAVRSRE